MTPIVVTQDRLEELAFENPGSSIEIHTHTSSLRVGDVLYVASLPEADEAQLAAEYGTERGHHLPREERAAIAREGFADRGTALAAQHIAEMKATAFGGGER